MRARNASRYTTPDDVIDESTNFKTIHYFITLWLDSHLETSIALIYLRRAYLMNQYQCCSSISFKHSWFLYHYPFFDSSFLACDFTVLPFFSLSSSPYPSDTLLSTWKRGRPGQKGIAMQMPDDEGDDKAYSCLCVSSTAHDCVYIQFICYRICNRSSNRYT